MAFYLKQDETVAESIKRICKEQIAKAIDEIEDKSLARETTVHQIRKRCKKIRGVTRLVRPHMEKTYQTENAWFREMARLFSGLRDADVFIDAYDETMEYFAEQVERPEFASIRRGLTLLRQHRLEQENDIGERLATFKKKAEEARDRIGDWPLKNSNAYGMLRSGLLKTYKRGRKAMENAYANPSPAAFHEWRKRVKYHRYHLRLLGRAWSPVVLKSWTEAKKLSDLLGDDHDLAELQRTLLEADHGFGKNRTVNAFLGLLEQRRRMLQTESYFLGLRIYAEKPKALGRRFQIYWNAWHAEHDAEPIR